MDYRTSSDATSCPPLWYRENPAVQQANYGLYSWGPAQVGPPYSHAGLIDCVEYVYWTSSRAPGINASRNNRLDKRKNAISSGEEVHTGTGYIPIVTLTLSQGTLTRGDTSTYRARMTRSYDSPQGEGP